MSDVSRHRVGAGGGTRTHDLTITNRLRFQLRHTGLALNATARSRPGRGRREDARQWRSPGPWAASRRWACARGTLNVVVRDVDVGAPYAAMDDQRVARGLPWPEPAFVLGCIPSQLTGLGAATSATGIPPDRAHRAVAGAPPPLSSSVPPGGGTGRRGSEVRGARPGPARVGGGGAGYDPRRWRRPRRCPRWRPWRPAADAHRRVVVSPGGHARRKRPRSRRSHVGGSARCARSGHAPSRRNPCFARCALAGLMTRWD